MTFLSDVRFAFRSLLRAKGLAATVVLTLALGIGANAAIYTLVRGVLLRPLVNRGEERLIYIRQSAPGIGAENVTFSVPEIQDIRERSKTLEAIGDFSTIGFTMVGLGDPPEIRAGVVGGSYFEVMGLKPVLGRLIGPENDGPNAPVAVVLTHHFWTTSLGSDPTVLGKTVRLGTRSATIVGVVGDIDDEHVVPLPTLTVYHPFEQQEIFGGRLFIHAPTDPYPPVPAVTRIVRGLSADQPVERAATLDDVRVEVLTPYRLNTIVFGGFAFVAVVIAVVGVAGVLAFSVSARTREFGIRLAVGSRPSDILTRVVLEGTILASAGVAVGATSGFLLARVLSRYIQEVQMPGALTVGASAILLLAAATVASALPAGRAARVDVMQTLRSE